MSAGRATAPRVLCLHGPTGCGKTHLLHAIPHANAQWDPSLRVRVATALELCRELTLAIREDRVEEMQRRHPDVDLLIVDDLHQVTDKPGYQSGLAITLAAWSHLGVRICGGSSTGPSELTVFTAALRRLLPVRWTELKHPTRAGTRAIVSALAVRDAIKVPAPILSCLVSRSGGDVRRIKGMLTHLRAAAALPDAPPAPPWMEEFPLH